MGQVISDQIKQIRLDQSRSDQSKQVVGLTHKKVILTFCHIRRNSFAMSSFFHCHSVMSVAYDAGSRNTWTDINLSKSKISLILAVANIECQMIWSSTTWSMSLLLLEFSKAGCFGPRYSGWKAMVSDSWTNM